jgi:hypothetical protein
MYLISKKTINEDFCKNLIDSLPNNFFLHEERHFSSSGKNFFYSYKGLSYLKLFCSQIKKRTSFFNLYDKPFIDHSYLLFKSPNAPATPAHQDASFWKNKKNSTLLRTAWISLENIDEHNGCLKIVDKNKINQMLEFNEIKPYVYKHNKSSKVQKGSFSWVLESSIIKSLNFIPLITETGDIIFFDSFAIHSSNINNTKHIRKSMKIVFNESVGIISVNFLLSNFVFITYLFIKIKNFSKNFFTFCKLN